MCLLLDWGGRLGGLNEVKAVILTGGTGTRLLPLTRLLNKHSLPVGKLPMICYSLYRLKEAGVTDILLVTGSGCGSFTDFLGSGNEFGVSLTYRIQEEAGGIVRRWSLRAFHRRRPEIHRMLGDNLLRRCR